MNAININLAPSVEMFLAPINADGGFDLITDEGDKVVTDEGDQTKT